jgi:Ion channel
MATYYNRRQTDSPVFDYLFSVFRNFWKKWPFKIFIIYVVFIFIFGYIYTKIHSKWPKSFAFQADIIDAKNEELSDTIQRRIQKAEAGLVALKKLTDVLARTTESPKSHPEAATDTVSFFADSYQFDFDFGHYPAANGDTRIEFWILIPSRVEHGIQTKDSLVDEWVDLSSKYQEPYPIDAYKEISSTVNANLENRLQQERTHLASLSKSTSEYWSFMDFLYFSAITQSTVGYGDILPNSTSVRIVVMVQVLVGIFLIVVAINLAASDIGRALRGNFEDDRSDPPEVSSHE